MADVPALTSIVAKEIKVRRACGEKPNVKLIAMKAVERDGITNADDIRRLAKAICISLNNRNVDARASRAQRDEYQERYSKELARRYP